jgi:hypothetical protein
VTGVANHDDRDKIYLAGKLACCGEHDSTGFCSFLHSIFEPDVILGTLYASKQSIQYASDVSPIISIIIISATWKLCIKQTLIGSRPATLLEELIASYPSNRLGRTRFGDLVRLQFALHGCFQANESIGRL